MSSTRWATRSHQKSLERILISLVSSKTMVHWGRQIKKRRKNEPPSLFMLSDFTMQVFAKSKSSWCVLLCTHHSAPCSYCSPSSYSLLDWLRTARVFESHTLQVSWDVVLYASLRSHSLLDGTYSPAYPIQDTSTPISQNQPIKGISEMN